jgi:uncharacterized protein
VTGDPVTDEPVTEEPLLSVRGETLLEVEPETAHVNLTITAKDADRSHTLRLLDERAKVLDGILAAFGDAIEKIETTGIRISPQFRNGKPRQRISGYVAEVQHHISVVDFDRLGELVAQLADQDLTTVSGPFWELRRDSQVHRDARVEAVKDAVGRARDYAEALGSRLTTLVELADTQLLSSGAAPAGPFAAARSVRRTANSASGPEEFTFDITPAKQTVRASVEARFRISAPDLEEAKRAKRT